MTWSEVPGAFAYYLPFYLGEARSWPRTWLEPPVYGYTRFNRDNPHGFYRRGLNWTGETAAFADRIYPEWRDLEPVERDRVLRQAALAAYGEEWKKQAVLTVVFALRGSEGSLVLALVAVWILVRRRPDFALAFLLLPAASTAVLLSLATHFIERYGFPFMPLGAVIFAMVVQTAVLPRKPMEWLEFPERCWHRRPGNGR